ncbi:MAG: Rab family GTPase [Candidatus Hodarchaeales archaeon]|jgi:small GTP-binding protein
MDGFVFRVAVIGEPGVGKTSLISRFTTGKFNYDTSSTIGVDFALKYVPIHVDNRSLLATLQIWDFAGEPRFRNVIAPYIPGTSGVILVFDNMKSLDALHEWIEIISIYINLDEIPLLLISTKSDFPTILNQEIIDEFVRDYQITNYYATSSLTGKNVEETFKRISQLTIVSEIGQPVIKY